MATTPDLTNSRMGATLVEGGATFRIWAPRARAVFIAGEFNEWNQGAEYRLTPIGGGHWAGFVEGLKDGDQYLFYVEGTGSSGYKRDPHARLLTIQPAFPLANCVLVDPGDFPWHETGFRAAAFSDLVIYQLHVGTFSIAPGNSEGNFLDVLERVPYLAALGVNALEPLPIQEFPSEFSLGYNGTDLFSPENDYAEHSEPELLAYFEQVNAILRSAGQPGYASVDVLRGSDNQLRALIDVCHVFGIAVIFDAVYNHAGGGFDDNSMWFLDRMPQGNTNDSLYFTDRGWAGGQVFAYWNDGVKQFLIDNARYFYDEYRVDGFRFDEVSVMERYGGWLTCQHLTDTLRAAKPEAIQIAEFWPVNDWVVKNRSDGGAGFDATWNDGLRIAVRAAIGAASSGRYSSVDMGAIANALQYRGLGNRWRSVNMAEDHDIVYAGRAERVAKLADGWDSRSWYGRSRSRVAMGLILTAPGIPMLFMGQELLEAKQWKDTPNIANLIDWGSLNEGDKRVGDFLRFTRELIGLRRNYPGLRGEGCAVIHASNQNRVVAFQRWVEGAGRDVVVVVSLNESAWYNYEIGFPGSGRWVEVFNSDVYDNWVNSGVVGNGGAVYADGPATHGLGSSARVTIPANGFVVFARG
jgi:1,4-alpha-glucan branching enzyme